MKEFPIPVRATDGAIGPVSQPDDDSFSYMPFPLEAPAFSMPQVPEDADAASVAAARRLLARFVEQMDDGATPRVELSALPAGVLRVLNESLGEGEVSVRIATRNGDGAEVRIQETVFAGVWRELHLRADGSVEHDWLHACPVPPVALERAQRAATTHLAPFELPRGAMNSPALLTEIREQVLHFRAGQPTHVINLSLLPLTPEDQVVLEQAAPVGPVAILSRGFGNCRITSTTLRNLWRVQYFNSMQTLILNTLEVVEVPEVAMAAADDLADSRERLRELLDWMSESGSA
ncbi:MAG: HupH hydrogenase expression protein [Burkholderiaceae bacterium]|jgi:hydrogenase-1 operon protein HyaF|nr:HupH hydrogenase expression protein [Burkholderiaceae bacterium]